ncbi:MAG: DUF1917 domain-containing protein, partial [Anaerolineae bacterium]|nr:DUF1917 domain-containing protein [Anaerolineae bacterium]
MSQPDSFKRALDLIRLVQDARMVHDAQATPSHVSAVYWIEAAPQTPGVRPTSRAGYWRLQTRVEAVDAVWQVVKTATENGRLGYKAKVATAAHGEDQDVRMIYVCTYDAADAQDVARV